MKKYPFRLVVRQGQNGVVEAEREDVTERCTLPMDVIINAGSELTGAQIDSGIPYGLPFGDFLSSKAEIALHKVGVWTVRDLYTKANAAVGALNSVGLKLSDVIRAAEIYEWQDHTAINLVAPKMKSKKEKKS